MLRAIEQACAKYNGTLDNTLKVIDKLKLLYNDALEVAEVLNSFNNINDQMKSVEGRVDSIMQELNVDVVESKKLYEKKIAEVGE